MKGWHAVCLYAEAICSPGSQVPSIDHSKGQDNETSAHTTKRHLVFRCWLRDSVDGELPQPVNTTQPTNPTDNLPNGMNVEDLVSITTSLDKIQVNAPEWANVTCTIKDVKGQTAVVDAAIAGSPDLMVEGQKATSTVAGQHEVRCTIPSVELEEFPAYLQVKPGAVQAVELSADPIQDVYELGDTVTLSWIVSDQYGNVITDIPGTLSGPNGGVKGLGDMADHKFQFIEEGKHTFTVTLVPPHANISDSAEFIVDGLALLSRSRALVAVKHSSDWDNRLKSSERLRTPLVRSSRLR